MSIEFTNANELAQQNTRLREDTIQPVMEDPNEPLCSCTKTGCRRTLRQLSRHFLSVFMMLALLYLTLAVTEGYSDREEQKYGTFVFNILFAGMLALGLRCVKVGRHIRPVAYVLVGFSFIWSFVAVGLDKYSVVTVYVNAIVLIILQFRTFQHVLRVQEPKFNDLMAAIDTYVMLGFTFTLVYSAIYFADNNSFLLPVGDSIKDSDKEERSTTFLYYSFVVLTTLGFGDIQPITPLPRAVSIIEAVIGQVYLVVLVARLVGLQISRRQQIDVQALANALIKAQKEVAEAVIEDVGDVQILQQRSADGSSTAKESATSFASK